MDTHVRILGILHLVFGGLGILLAIFFLVLFGGITGAIGLNASNSDDALIAIPIVGGIGALIVVATTALALPGLLAGWGLLQYKPWARTLTLVLSVFELFHVPFGTALGFYGFWVLLSPEGTALFQRRAPVYGERQM